jgi:hypothetical protein
LQIVGEGEENAQDKEGQTDDGNRKNVPPPELPEVVGGFFEEKLYFLGFQSASFRISFPLYRNKILLPK